jgi:hypothetical protein
VICSLPHQYPVPLVLHSAGLRGDTQFFIIVDTLRRTKIEMTSGYLLWFEGGITKKSKNRVAAELSLNSFATLFS